MHAHSCTHTLDYSLTHTLIHRYGVYTYEETAMMSLGSFGKYTLAMFTAITNLLANSAHMKTAVQLLHDEMELYVTPQPFVKPRLFICPQRMHNGIALPNEFYVFF
jgi:hypothetical protein